VTQSIDGLLEKASELADGQQDKVLLGFVKLLDFPGQGSCEKHRSILSDYVKAAINRTRERRRCREKGDGFRYNAEALWRLMRTKFHDAECTCFLSHEERAEHKERTHANDARI
jgi:hypothetical protein